MKKLILSMAAIAMMLTSCNENDITSSFDGETTTVKASFGFHETSAMAQSPVNLDKDVPSKITAGTTIYKQVPVNVSGFTVVANSVGQNSVSNRFNIEAPEGDNVTTPTFNLNNIYVGENEFTTTLNLYSAGVPVNSTAEFALVEGAFPLDGSADIAAAFDKSESISNMIVERFDNSRTLNLGAFSIINGGAKIIFTGDDTYNTKFTFSPVFDQADRVIADGADEPSYSDDPFTSYIDLEPNAQSGLVINDNSFEDSNTKEYVVTATRISDQGTTQEELTVSKKITLTKGYCLNLSVRFDEDFHIVIDVLAGVEITIGNFGVELPK